MNNKYIYLSKEKAKKGIALVYEILDRELSENEIINRYGNNICLYIGEDLPHYITYVDELDIVREATEEEKLERGNRDLYMGEIYTNGKIKQIEIPQGIIKPVWNNEKEKWEEKATREELIEVRKNKIVEYEKLKEEKQLLKKSKFLSEDELKIVVEQIIVLEKEINSLSEKIKLL
ncbi:MAG: hypothetical protein OGM09_01400 [Fusobacterium varium]|uniref:hypothetical protein n=1 Tax=Fusobacterium TaxID=848 RepID=UPI000E7FE5B4|nr:MULTISPECIES: hypothetical protein [Fusobacterium]UYI78900.1 MAG: hypothetical protein OGM09_01400 [Fusobacterium varium]HBJ78397.1 hypothetical protein [Fusobacterium sp.]